jgi:hypothetical protein
MAEPSENPGSHAAEKPAIDLSSPDLPPIRSQLMARAKRRPWSSAAIASIGIAGVAAATFNMVNERTVESVSDIFNNSTVQTTSLTISDGLPPLERISDGESHEYHYRGIICPAPPAIQRDNTFTSGQDTNSDTTTEEILSSFGFSADLAIVSEVTENALELYEAQSEDSKECLALMRTAVAEDLEWFRNQADAGNISDAAGVPMDLGALLPD